MNRNGIRGAILIVEKYDCLVADAIDIFCQSFVVIIAIQMSFLCNVMTTK